jgi:hypothetical protein
MQMQNVPAKKSFRVDELAKELGVKKFILKNWEKQFDLKRCGLDNKYSQEDFKIFATIKNLVFIKKMPQSVAKKHLQEMLSGKDFFESNQELSGQIAQEIAETSALENAVQDMNDHAMTTQEMASDEMVAEERAQAFIAKGLGGETENTFQGAYEDFQSEKIAKEKIEPETSVATSQIDFAETSDTMLPEEIINKELLAVQSADDVTEVSPAFKDKEAFFKTIQLFKEELLKIHEQLK